MARRKKKKRFRYKEPSYISFVDFVRMVGDYGSWKEREWKKQKREWLRKQKQ